VISHQDHAASGIDNIPDKSNTFCRLRTIADNIAKADYFRNISFFYVFQHSLKRWLVAMDV
jgi:hypothetical protein